MNVISQWVIHSIGDNVISVSGQKNVTEVGFQRRSQNSFHKWMSKITSDQSPPLAPRMAQY